MTKVQTYEKGKVARLHNLNHQITNDLSYVDDGMPLVYTPCKLKNSRRGRTFVIGTFGCPICPSSWVSGHICVEIFFHQTLHLGKRFDVVVWSQKCRVCKVVAVPDVETDTYVERVTSKLQLYLGRRERMIRPRDVVMTKPHISHLCCACMAGVCKEV